jgi:hypothetical protein
MQKIPIHLAEPGMVLAKPIISDTGMQLCAEETVLTASIIERLKKMQIIQVTLKGNPVDSDVKQPTNLEAVKELNARFSKIKNDPIMNKLRAAIENALTTQSEEDPGSPSKADPP